MTPFYDMRNASDTKEMILKPLVLQDVMSPFLAEAEILETSKCLIFCGIRLS
jgi:hypothetical protein